MLDFIFGFLGSDGGVVNSIEKDYIDVLELFVYSGINDKLKYFICFF